MSEADYSSILGSEYTGIGGGYKKGKKSRRSKKASSVWSNNLTKFYSNVAKSQKQQGGKVTRRRKHVKSRKHRKRSRRV